MSIYKTLEKAMEDKDADAFIGLLHDDFQFVRHQSGTVLNRDEMAAMIGQMMASDAVAVRGQRLLYENDDIVVEHSVMDFPDGTTEAVMTVNMLKDGKIVRLETGATPLKG